MLAVVDEEMPCHRRYTRAGSPGDLGIPHLQQLEYVVPDVIVRKRLIQYLQAEDSRSSKLKTRRPVNAVQQDLTGHLVTTRAIAQKGTLKSVLLTYSNMRLGVFDWASRTMSRS